MGGGGSPAGRRLLAAVLAAAERRIGDFAIDELRQLGQVRARASVCARACLRHGVDACPACVRVGCEGRMGGRGGGGEGGPRT